MKTEKNFVSNKNINEISVQTYHFYNFFFFLYKIFIQQTLIRKLRFPFILLKTKNNLRFLLVIK